MGKPTTLKLGIRQFGRIDIKEAWESCQPLISGVGQTLCINNNQSIMALILQYTPLDSVPDGRYACNITTIFSYFYDLCKPKLIK